MRIQIETRSRWRFTLTSPNHDGVEKTTRPGAKPFASQESKSITVVNAIPKSSGRSLEAFDIAEEDRPSPVPSSKASRCRSFRKRIGRFFVQSCRMHPDDHTRAFYDAGDPLPPYECFRMSELPADSLIGSSAIQELPDPLLMTPEIFGQDVFELASYAPHEQHVRGSLVDAMQDQTIRTGYDTPKPRYPTLGYAIPQGFEPVATPVHPDSVNTTQQLYALPGMTSRDHSHDSSPISPFTPRSNASPGIQTHPGYGSTVSTQELISPEVEQFGMFGQVYPAMQGYRPIPALTTPVSAYSTGLSTSSTPTTDNESFATQRYMSFPSASSSSFHNLPSTSPSSFQDSSPYQQPSRESLPPQDLVPNLETLRPYYEDRRLGTWEFSGNSSWIRQPSQEAGTVASNITNPSSQVKIPRARQRSAPSHVDRGQNTPRPANMPPNRSKAVPFPPEVCIQCGTKFTGSYRKGNLKRHVRERHSLFESLVGKACRICKQGFNRADAKRKHEWKKHRLLDAKPNKRRN
ncbi:Nn.00g018980.m01.CDS01 [Neocucurbitaria sp. VM-36]